jgi:hypothetical protein
MPFNSREGAEENGIPLSPEEVGHVCLGVLGGLARDEYRWHSLAYPSFRDKQRK